MPKNNTASSDSEIFLELIVYKHKKRHLVVVAPMHNTNQGVAYSIFSAKSRSPHGKL
jgi:hypothetical protein